MPTPPWQLLWYVWPEAARDAARRGTEAGRAALAEERCGDAVRLFTDALAAARQAYGREHTSVVEPLSGLAAALVGAKREHEAARFVDQVLAFVDRGGVAEDDWIQAHRDAGDLYYRLGRLRTALALFRRIEARLSDRVEHAARVAEVVWQQALAHRWLLELDRMRELVLRLPASWTALSSVLLGRAAFLEGDYEAAVGCYETVLRTMPAPRSYRDDARQVEASMDGAIVGSRLALALHRAGRIDEARRERERAQRALDHLEGMSKRRALAVVAFDDGEVDETAISALGHHRFACALRARLDGPTDPSTIESRMRVAELSARLGDHATAHAEASALRSTLDDGFGRDHPWAKKARELVR